MTNDRHGKIAVRMLVADTDEVGRVIARIVADEHVIDQRAEVGWNPIEHLRQCRSRVVRDYDDSNTRRWTRLASLHPPTVDLARQPNK